MNSHVTVTTGARLHFGLLAIKPPAGREFGGLGLMLQNPRCTLTVTRTASEDCVLADAERTTRLLDWLRQLRQDNAIPADRGFRVELSETLAAHAGLGSGTQLALALSAALLALQPNSSTSPANLARKLGRGRRSLIGLSGFSRGGFLVEGGQSPRTSSFQPALKGEEFPLIGRYEFPEAWRVLLVTPTDAAGFSGHREVEAFHQLPGMSRAVTAELCRLTLMQIVPALLAEDFAEFAPGIGQFGQLVGDYFAPVQGGRLAHPLMRTLAAELNDRGYAGCGQSSWGPTLFVMLPEEAAAIQLQAELAADARYRNCNFQLTAARNTGAELSIAATA